MEVEVPSASPFASSLLFAFIAAYMYEADTPLAERRAAALTLDRDLLRELLGEGELRELLSAEVIAAIELELQRLTPERAARSAEAITDLLRDLGPLTTGGIDDRSRDTEVGAALEELAEARRVIPVHLGGESRWAVVEDAARLRDALGVQPPPGVPQVFLEPVDDPLGDVIGRFARTHAPFRLEDVAAELHLAPSVVENTLHRLEKSGRVVRGSFTPGHTGSEWVDAEVLRRIKRRSLAELRGEIEPVEAAAVGRFLPSWHGIGRDVRGRTALLEVIQRLQGADVPASSLERDVLASRVIDAPGELDRLMLEGEVVWVGRGSIGPRDGRLALYLRSQLPLLHLPLPGDPPAEPVHDAIRAHLEQRGASFFADIYAAVGGGDLDAALEALWDLVWAGEITNDTLAPVRAFLSRHGRSGRPRTLPSSFPPHAAGRWSLVAHLVTGPASDTARAAAWATQLLDRHGVVTRATVSAEGIPGGFSGLYPVLSQMEESGRVRRGYFIEGQGGAQFATPGAVDRIRSTAPDGHLALATTDPANPYGASLPWPEATTRLARSAGTYVLLGDGELAGYVERNGRAVTLWGRALERPEETAAALAEVASRHSRFTIENVNDDPAGSSPLAEALLGTGFAPAVKGLRWRGARARG
jgi:ATP-dependent helicase Lhr and Lhr-like helicase